MRRLITALAILMLAIFVHQDTKAEIFKETGSIERLDPALDDLIEADAKIEILAAGFIWSEGPVWIPDTSAPNKHKGYLLFSDIPNNRVMKWSENVGISVYLKPSGYTGNSPRSRELGCNGLLLDPKGRLTLCQHGDRRVAYMDATLQQPRSTFVTIADRFDGKRFSSPNDAVYHKNGDLYFTDPPYGLAKGAKKEIEFQGVYQATHCGKVKLLTKELERPNGITFSPDYKTLYVANSFGKNPIWRAYDVNAEGDISNSRIFFDARNIPNYKKRPGGNDGMKVDIHGNVFATGPGGVLIFTPQGKWLGSILTGERTANCAFGDDGRTLYMTADNYLLRVRLKTTGFGF